MFSGIGHGVCSSPSVDRIALYVRIKEQVPRLQPIKALYEQALAMSERTAQREALDLFFFPLPPTLRAIENERAW